jgi:uncharacterized RDD family membrane protein YckC
LLPFVTPAAEAATAVSSPRTLYLMSSQARVVSAAVMLAAAAVYCAGLWSGGRRTLAMRTWRLALTTQDGNDVGVIRALGRFAACFAGPVAALIAYLALQPSGQGRWAVALLGLNYAWVIADPEGQFLQDRIARTRLVLRL